MTVIVSCRAKNTIAFIMSPIDADTIGSQFYKGTSAKKQNV